MKVAYCVKPYEDEILYSQIARILHHTAGSKTSSDLHSLFNKRGYTAAIDLPTNLNALWQNCYYKIITSPDAIIDQYTLYPFYRHFLKHDKQLRIREGMKQHEGTLIDSVKAINASGIQRIRFPKFCQQCIVESQQRYEEAYWRKSHQVPGMLVCTIHNVLLQEYSPQTSEVNSNMFVAAEQISKRSKNIPVNKNRKMLKFSRMLHAFQTNRVEFDINATAYKQVFTTLYPQRMGINFTELVDDFQKFYGRQILDHYFPPQPRQLSWIYEVVKKPQKCFSSLKHVLLYNFIGNKYDGQLKLFNE